MKKMFALLLSLFVLLIPTLTLGDIADMPTERQQPLLVDEGDVLTDAEEAEILAELERVSAEQNCDVAILVPASLGYKSATEYADDWYDYNGYGQGNTKDGILLLVCMEERDYADTTNGMCKYWFNDEVLYGVEDDYIPYLRENNCYGAFKAFIRDCESVLRSADRREILYLDDQGGFFPSETVIPATRKLEAYSYEADCDFVVLTVQSLNGQTAAEYVTSVYETGNYRHSDYDDKIVLVIDRAASKCYCVYGGGVSNCLSDSDASAFETNAASALSAGDPLKMVRDFSETAYNKLLSAGFHNSTVTPTNPTYPTERSVQIFSGFRAFLSLGLGAIVSLITTGSMKGKLKSVQSQQAAADYMRRDAMHMTDTQDLFLYSNVARTLRQSESSRSGSSGGGHSGGGGSSHFSSSGGSHGGHSGKF